MHTFPKALLGHSFQQRFSHVAHADEEIAMYRSVHCAIRDPVVVVVVAVSSVEAENVEDRRLCVFCSVLSLFPGV